MVVPTGCIGDDLECLHEALEGFIDATGFVWMYFKRSFEVGGSDFLNACVSFDA